MDCLTFQKGEPVLYQWKTDSPSVSSLYQSFCIAVCQSLAKLLHGTDALASILFGQAACRDPKLTLGPFTHMHALDGSPWSHRPTSQHKLLWSTVSSAIRCLPLICPLDKRPSKLLTKTLLFRLKLANPALAWEPQSTPPMDSDNDMCARACLSLSALSLDLPVMPHQTCLIPSSRPVKMNFSISPSLVVCF